MLYGREAMGEELDGQGIQTGAKHTDAKFVDARRDEGTSRQWAAIRRSGFRFVRAPNGVSYLRSGAQRSRGRGIETSLSPAESFPARPLQAIPPSREPYRSRQGESVMPQRWSLLALAALGTASLGGCNTSSSTPYRNTAEQERPRPTPPEKPDLPKPIPEPRPGPTHTGDPGPEAVPPMPPAPPQPTSTAR